MSKKKNAVMLADTRPALVGVVLMQLAASNPYLFEEAIIYYIDEIPDNDKKLMEGLMPCRFVKYQCPLPKELFDKPRFKLFSPLMFARFEMPAYLKEFETITWLDTDIYIQGDICGLIDAAEQTGAAFVREDPVNKTAEKPDRMRTCFTEEIQGYRLNEYLYCSGTIVLTDHCTDRYDGLTQWCYQKTCEWADILSLPDQGVLNAAIQEFQIQVTPLSGKIYCCYPYMHRDVSQARIIHAWGLNKFWNDWYLYKKYEQWAGMYKHWLTQGGCPLPFAIAPKISVVIPSYQPDLELFRQCIDSLMQQNRDGWERYSDFEVIIVAEPFGQKGITDFVESYHDRRIRLIFNEERKGIAASLNRGIREAQGSYIARMDDDDIAAGNRLYLQKIYLDKHPEYALCTSDFAYFGDMNEKRVSFEGEVCRAWSVFTCPFDHPTVMFRKDYFTENELYYDEKRGFVEDWELWQRAFEKGMKVGCVHEVLLHHRWVNQASAGQNSRTVDMMREMIQENFQRLQVEIVKEDLPYIGPWNGMVSDQDVYGRVKNYFEAALENNERLLAYDQDSLTYVFQLRMEEMRTGQLPGLAEKEQKKTAGVILKQETYRSSPLKLFFKRLLLPLYKPLKYRYEERLKLLVQKELENEGHIMDCIYKLDDQKQALIELADMVKVQESQWEQLLDAAADIFKMQAADQNKILQNRMDAFRMQAEEQKQMLERAAEGHVQQLEQINHQSRLLNDHIYNLQNEVRYMKEMRENNLKVRKKILLIGTPEHSNAGDAAITLGEIEFIRKYFKEYHLVELSKYDYEGWKDRVTGLIGREDMIFLQGGGNMGNRYLEEEKMRREIIEGFPDNKIVILPQTIWFEQSPEGERECENSADIYNRHRNLVIFVRGRQSFQVAKKYFNNGKIAVMPDMALMLKTDFSRRRRGILLCLRTLEDEGCFTGETRKQLQDMLHEKRLQYDMETNWNQNDPEANIYKDMRRTVVYDKLKNYASHQAVITDRLHGLIFSVITNTPCIVLSTYNYKMDESYDCMKESNAVFFAGRKAAHVGKLLDQALSVTDVKYPLLDQGQFEEMYRIIVMQENQ